MEYGKAIMKDWCNFCGGPKEGCTCKSSEEFLAMGNKYQKRILGTAAPKLGQPGCKLDQGKPDLLTALQQFPDALAAVSEISRYGAEVKGYGWNSWKEVEDGEERYKRAMIRHASVTGPDDESGLSSAAHTAWNVLASLSFEIKRENGDG